MFALRKTIKRQFAVRLVVLVVFTSLLTAAGQTPPAIYNANTTRTNFVEPALTGALDLTTVPHQAGYTFTEPLLSGATVYRVTDASTDVSTPGRNFSAPDCSECRAFNTDSTKFYLLDLNGGGIYPFSWNGTVAARLGSAALPTGGLQLTEGSLINGGSALPSWSGKNAQLLYGTLDNGSSLQIRQLDFTTVNSSSTTVPVSNLVSLSAVFTTVNGGTLGGSLCSLGVSGVDAANDFIVTGFNGGQDTWQYAFWYNKATGRYKVLDTFSNPMRVWDSNAPGWVNNAFAGGLQLHNVKIAQDGETVLMTPTGSRQLFWNTTTDLIQQSNVALDGGHRSAGYGVVFNQYPNGTDASQWIMRLFTSLTVATFLVDPTLSDPSSVPQYPALNPDFDDHSSTHNQRSGLNLPLMSSTSRVVDVDVTHPWRPYDNEVVAVRTDATRGVFRIAHHYSRNITGGPRAPGYYDNGFGQTSPDGLYFIYGSNHGMTLSFASGTNPNTGAPCAPCYRIDSFIVTLPVSAPPPGTNGGTVIRGKAVIRGKVVSR